MGHLCTARLGLQPTLPSFLWGRELSIIISRGLIYWIESLQNLYDVTGVVFNFLCGDADNNLMEKIANYNNENNIEEVFLMAYK